MVKSQTYEAMDGWNWYCETWEELKGARLEFFFASILIYLPLVILNRIPLFGSAISSFSIPLFYMGAYFVSRKWHEKKEKELSVIFKAFTDRDLFRKLLPLCLASMGFGILNAILYYLPLPAILTAPIKVCVFFTQMAILCFGPPLMVFDSYDIKKAMSLSVKMLVDNLPVFVVTLLVGFLLTLMGFATVGIGLLFLLPVFVYLPYHIYISVFSKKEKSLIGST